GEPVGSRSGEVRNIVLLIVRLLGDLLHDRAIHVLAGALLKLLELLDRCLAVLLKRCLKAGVSHGDLRQTCGLDAVTRDQSRDRHAATAMTGAYTFARSLNA